MKRKNGMSIILSDTVILLLVVTSASASLGIHSNFPSLHISPLLDNFQHGCQCKTTTFIIHPGTGTISSALSNTKDGDIWILLKGTYYDNVVINKSISIKGAGPGCTFVNGTGFLGSVFTIEPTKKVVLAAMTIQNGIGTNIKGVHMGGGIYNSGTLTLDHVVVTDNYNPSTNIGGGIYNNGTLNLNNVLITNNSAAFGAGVYNDGSGGSAIVNMNRCSSITGNKNAWSGSGIYNIDGTINMNKGSSITNNTAIWGGGILNDDAGGAGHTTILNMNKGSSIAYNTVKNDGGGIYNSGHGGTVTINMNQGRITGNIAKNYGGGIYNDGQSGIATVNMNKGSSITCNIAGYYGGGIYNDGDHGIATVNMNKGSSITHNTAKNPKPSGGGVYSTNNGGTATVNQKPCSSIICNTPDNIVS